MEVTAALFTHFPIVWTVKLLAVGARVNFPKLSNYESCAGPRLHASLLAPIPYLHRRLQPNNESEVDSIINSQIPFALQ